MSLTEVKLAGEAPPLAFHRSEVSPGSARPGSQTQEPLGISWDPLPGSGWVLSVQSKPIPWSCALAPGTSVRSGGAGWGQSYACSTSVAPSPGKDTEGNPPTPDPPNHTVFLFYPPLPGTSYCLKQGSWWSSDGGRGL